VAAEQENDHGDAFFSNLPREIRRAGSISFGAALFTLRNAQWYAKVFANTPDDVTGLDFRYRLVMKSGHAATRFALR